MSKQSLLILLTSHQAIIHAVLAYIQENAASRSLSSQNQPKNMPSTAYIATHYHEIHRTASVALAPGFRVGDRTCKLRGCVVIRTVDKTSQLVLLS
jgi:hypothetical protein